MEHFLDAPALETLIRNNPLTTYIPRGVDTLQWFDGAGNWDYVVTEATMNDYRRQPFQDPPPKLPRPALLSLVATLSPHDFSLHPDAVYPTVDEDHTARYAGGSVLLEDPLRPRENTEFKAGWSGLLELANAPLPASMDVCETHSFFRMVGYEPAVRLVHTFYAVRIPSPLPLQSLD